jgi:hypothetical protein
MELRLAMKSLFFVLVVEADAEKYASPFSCKLYFTDFDIKPFVGFVLLRIFQKNGTGR